MNEETIYIAVPQREHWIEFDENLSVEVCPTFPLTSRFLRHWSIIVAHVAVKIGYYFTVFWVVALFCGVVDICIVIIKYLCLALIYGLINLGSAIKYGIKKLYCAAIDSVKAFLIKMLSVLGIFAGGYIIYLFFKTGAWTNVWVIIKTMFGL